MEKPAPKESADRLRKACQNMKPPTSEALNAQFDAHRNMKAEHPQLVIKTTVEINIGELRASVTMEQARALRNTLNEILGPEKDVIEKHRELIKKLEELSRKNPPTYVRAPWEIPINTPQPKRPQWPEPLPSYPRVWCQTQGIFQ